jgi:hypothetical protein
MIPMASLLKKLAGFMPRKVKAWARRWIDRWKEPGVKERLLRELRAHNTLLAHWFYTRGRESPRAQEPKRLLKYGFKVYSQHDEDGITEEIFRRIGCTNRYFVEFGVGDGLENGTMYCLLHGWQGAWIDGSAMCVEAIEKRYQFLLQPGRLKLLYAIITAENIEQLFRQMQVPEEFDLLSIDIDRNDYWVWKAITHYRPRVVAIEYNASFQKTACCVIPYDPSAIWNKTNYFGASLKAFEELGRSKGYCLVGCNFTGVTAFFVRQDLVADHFAEPFTSENHFEPPRYFVRMPNGHPECFGPLVFPT